MKNLQILRSVALKLSVLVLGLGIGHHGHAQNVDHACCTQTRLLAQSEDERVTPGRNSSDMAAQTEEVFRADLMYKFLIGEFAKHNQLHDLSAQAFAELLRSYESPLFAEMAAEAANVARRVDLARQAAEVWYRLEPESVKAKFVYLTVMLRNNQFEIARPIVSEFFSSVEGDPEKKLQYVHDLVGAATDSILAFDFYEEVTASVPDSYLKKVLLGQLAWRAGLTKSAIKYADDAILIDASSEQAVLLKASALRQLDVGQSIDFLTSYLDAHPDAGSIRASAVGDLLSEERYEDAIPHLRQLIEDEPANSNVRFTLALVLYEVGQYADAKDRVHVALSLGYEDRPAAYYQLGLIEEKLGSNESAINWFKSVPKGDRYIEAQTQLARLMANLEGVEPTIDYLKQKGAENPEHRIAFIELQGKVYLESGLIDQYFSVLDQGLETYPDHPSLLYSSAMAAERLGRIDLLEERLLRLIKVQPNNPQAFNALGYTLADVTDRYDEAKIFLTRALELSPDDPTIIDSMGWVDFKLKDYQSSLGLLEHAYELEKHPEIAAHLGEVLWVLGREDDAKSIWSDAVMKHPSNDVLLETLKRHGVD